MERLTGLALAALLAVVVLVTAAATAVLSVIPGGAGKAWACAGDPLAEASGALPLTGEQAVNAATIVQTARRLGLPPRAAVIAVATALQESGLRNLDHGHADSLGLFQQRPSQGWGDAPAGPGDHRTAAQRIRDPEYAATAFYRALTAVTDWESLPLTVAAQAVQRSAYPDAYTRWEPLATRTVAALTAQDCLDTLPSASNEAAATAIAYARAQLGLPYQWGGNGPDDGDAGFDCSGLTTAAYAAAGITLPRTAQTQYDAGPHVPPGEPLQPGDLVFYGTPADVHHVGLYLGHNKMINAPRRGATIRIEDFHRRDYLGATRPWASDVVVRLGTGP